MVSSTVPIRRHSKVLLVQIGESNARIQAAASETIIYLAGLKCSGLSYMAFSFVKTQR